MSKDQATFVFRVQGLPASQADAALISSLRTAISSESPNEQSNHEPRISIVPSCYHNERLKVALVEFESPVPEFLSPLKEDPLGEEVIQMNETEVSFDCHFHGFTQLYCPNSDPPIADVIAITGLDGHAYGSWKTKGKLAKMWLRHFLSEDLPACRTMIYGYNSKLLVRGTKTIIDYGREFLNELKKIRNTDELRKRPIIFIAHSFGGVILAHCLVKAVQTNDDDHPTISSLYHATYGMLLFGIPHKGLIIDDLERMVAHETDHPVHSLLKDIKPDSGMLASQSVDFKNLIRDRKVVSFYETRQTRQLQFDEDIGSFRRTGNYITLVNSDSALLHLPDTVEDKVAVDADHSLMVKFKSKHTSAYTDALSRLREFSSYAPSVVAERFSHSSTNLIELRESCMSILRSSNTSAQQKALEGEWFYEPLPDRGVAGTKHSVSNKYISHGILETFEATRQEFLRTVASSERLELSGTATIGDVYDATDRIQKEQALMRSLRNLNRIKPYLERADHYASVIKTFVKVKTVHTSIIWASLKLILNATSTSIRAFDAVIASMSEVGEALPLFESYTGLPWDSDTMKHVLCVFYRDILDFHATLILLCGRRRWKLYFESIWPQYAGKVSVIRQNMERHRLLLDSKVTQPYIAQALSARVQAYRVYEESHKSQRQQMYTAFKNSLKLIPYDKELEELTRTCMEDSGAWLLNSEPFSAWLGAQTRMRRILWIQGIPGAGKTYLASTIIQHLKSMSSDVVFAFLTYRATKAVTTLEVLHSLLFQFISENPDLQRDLCEAVGARHRQFASSMASTLEVFGDILGDSATSFVIDGLDEITEPKRESLLNSLFHILDSSPNVKILISSRDEHDVSRLLGSRADVIRLHDKNGRDVEQYVRKRTDRWLRTLDLRYHIELELRQLLSSIASKAEGMFLYARLVLDDIESQSNVEQIRREAKDLPNGLKEAYGRILTRIDQDLGIQQSKEARTILAWVACSSVPLTKHEIQLAVAVKNGFDPSKGVQETLLNVIQRCGPIIEFQDDAVQFVHFTAKEYLMSEQSERYLDIVRCNINVAMTCMNYLASKCFDLSLSDADIRAGILSGAYVLESYAATYWLQHVEDAISQSREAPYFYFCWDIDRFLEKRRRPEFKLPIITYEDRVGYSNRFGPAWVTTSSTLKNVSDFFCRRQEGIPPKRVHECIDWDPLSITAAQARNFDILDSMLCRSQVHQENCSCLALRRIYGTRLFKCERPGCTYFLTGFPTRRERDRHSAAHNRSFKCPIQTCHFAEVGFVTQSNLSTHLIKIHGQEPQPIPELGAPVNGGNDARPTTQEGTSISSHTPPDANVGEQVERLLIEAVKSNNFEYINEYWSLVTSKMNVLLRAAIQYSSMDMLELLLDECSDLRAVDKYMLNHASKLDKVAAARKLIERGAQIWDLNTEDRHSDLHHAISNCSPDMIALLLENGSRDVADGFEKLIPGQKNDAAEDKAIRCFDLLDKEHLVTSRRHIQACFKINAEKCFSIRIATCLLKLGAQVNESNALYTASINTGEKAARFMEFLLKVGAKPPVAGKRSLPIAERPGPRVISQWLGMTWHELLERYSGVSMDTNDYSGSIDL